MIHEKEVRLWEMKIEDRRMFGHIRFLFDFQDLSWIAMSVVGLIFVKGEPASACVSS